MPAILMAAGCTPTVRVEAPKEPIVINLNVKIEQEVRVKVDRDVEVNAEPAAVGGESGQTTKRSRWKSFGVTTARPGSR